MNISDNSMTGKGSTVDHANLIFFKLPICAGEKTPAGIEVDEEHNTSQWVSILKKKIRNHRENIFGNF